MVIAIEMDELKDEVKQIKNDHPGLKDDTAFVFWFLLENLVESNDEAEKALGGESGDKGIDAIYIDHSNKVAYLIQGKFRQSAAEQNEKRNDIFDLADKALIVWAEDSEQRKFYSKLAPRSRRLFQELVRYVRSGYALRLYYVTTGRCSSLIRDEAVQRAGRIQHDVELTVYDWPDVCRMFNDYLEGVAPAIPSLSLRIASNGRVRSEGSIYRFDPQTNTESWVFSMPAKDAGDMFTKAGPRLFARNIRGYLGDTQINKAIAETLVNEPHNFWYYNNGITIVCDSAKQEKQRGQDVLRVERPQVINGQQTVRTLNQTQTQMESASVLVKVIRVAREGRSEDNYDDLVKRIVRATNWQNSIKASDLVSNDRVQVFLEREFRKAEYLYIRKRQTKQEARAGYNGSAWAIISKDELAQAVAACNFDPAIVREGKEGLFEDNYYRSIFTVRDISSYLAPYWLMRRVQRVAKGKPDWAYAKWLVLHFAWKRLYKYIGTRGQQQKFRQACEQEDDIVLKSLDKALDGIFRAVHSFYRLERGTGEQARDPSTFFQLYRLNTKFSKFWNTESNRQREKVEEHIEKFYLALTHAK